MLLAAVAVIHLGLTSHDGDFAGGWSVDGPNLHIGFVRLMYPFFGGLLLFRLGKIVRVPHAFWVCSGLIVTVLALPRFGGETHYWMNGLYESLCIILIFPLIVAMGAGGTLGGKYSAGICDFLGRISYPIYITHYSLIYIYTAYVTHGNLLMTQTYPYALLVFFGSLVLAYGCLRFYDEPLPELVEGEVHSDKSKRPRARARKKLITAMHFICKQTPASLTRLFAASFFLTTTMLKSTSSAGEIAADHVPASFYPALALCIASPGNTTYYIDSNQGR